jgi:hypothetical protein
MNLLAPIASLALWVLLVAGWLLGELHVKGTTVFGAALGRGLRRGQRRGRTPRFSPPTTPCWTSRLCS